MGELFTRIFGEWAPVLPENLDLHALSSEFFLYVCGPVDTTLGNSTWNDLLWVEAPWPDFLAIDWPWVVGVFLFVLTLVSVFKLIGGVLGGR